MVDEQCFMRIPAGWSETFRPANVAMALSSVSHILMPSSRGLAHARTQVLALISPAALKKNFSPFSTPAPLCGDFDISPIIRNGFRSFTILKMISLVYHYKTGVTR